MNGLESRATNGADGRGVRAEIVSVGTELTSGAVLDTNSQWLSCRLAEVGIPVLLHSTVADDLFLLVQVLRAAVQRAEVVLVTGGLGPTQDDLTRQALAELVGQPLVLHEPSLKQIQQFFARRNRHMPQRNRVQALFPQGATPLPNPVGTAPGIWLEVPRSDGRPCQLAALPGVPSEMKLMFQEQVLPRLPAAQQVLLKWEIHCYGAGESAIEERLGELTARGRDPEVGITAHEATISLRITAQGRSRRECRQKIERVRSEIHKRLGSLIFAEGDKQLHQTVLELLQQRSLTLAVAEIGSDGWLVHRLAQADPDGRSFVFGTVCRNEQKLEERWLGGKRCDQPPGSDTSCFKEQRLLELAQKLRHQCGSDIGLVVNVVASTAGRSADQPVEPASAQSQKGNSALPQTFWEAEPALPLQQQRTTQPQQAEQPQAEQPQQAGLLQQVELRRRSAEQERQQQQHTALQAVLALAADDWQQTHCVTLAGNPALSFIRAAKDALNLLRLKLLEQADL